MRIPAFYAALCIGIFIHTPAIAGADTYLNFEAIPAVLKKSLQPVMSEETYIGHIRKLLRHDGRMEIIAKKLDEEKQSWLELQNFQSIIFYDLDRDTRVTREEIDRSKSYCATSFHSGAEVTTSCGPPPKAAIDAIMKSDIDHDEFISYKEMWAFNGTDAERESLLLEFTTLSELLALDPNNDGILTLIELEGVARKAFATVDTNGDKVFSNEENEAAKKLPYNAGDGTADREMSRHYDKKCTLGDIVVPENLVVYGAGEYNGKSLGRRIEKSGTQAGEFTVTVNVKDRPVALILGAYDPSIWHIRRTKGTVIHSVVAGGFYRQAIFGTGKNTPTLVSYYGHRPTSDDRSDGNDACGYFYFQKDRIADLNPLSRHFYGRNAALFVPAENGTINIGEAPAPDEEILSEPYTIADVVPDEEELLSAVEKAEKAGILRRATKADVEAWLDAYEAKERANPTVDIVPLVDGKDSLRDAVPHIDLRFRNVYVVLKEYEIPDAANRNFFIIPKGIAVPTGGSYIGIYDMNTVTCWGSPMNMMDSERQIRCPTSRQTK